MVWKVRIPLYVFSWKQNVAFKKLYDCWCALSVRSRCLNIEIITLPSLARFSYRTFPAIMVPAQVPTGVVGFLTFEWGAHSASVFTISRADVSKDYNLLGMGKSICASLLFIHTHTPAHMLVSPVGICSATKMFCSILIWTLWLEFDSWRTDCYCTVDIGWLLASNFLPLLNFVVSFWKQQFLRHEWQGAGEQAYAVQAPPGRHEVKSSKSSLTV